MSSKHTPGPWEARRTSGNGEVATIYGLRGGYVTIFGKREYVGKTEDDLYEEREADLRIVLAAPDLLAACKQVLDASEDNGDMEDIDWNALRSAIARAEGTN